MVAEWNHVPKYPAFGMRNHACIRPRLFNAYKSRPRNTDRGLQGNTKYPPSFPMGVTLPNELQ